MVAVSFVALQPALLWGKVGGVGRTRHGRPRHRGVAQLAEHWSPKPAVESSIPSAPAFVLGLWGVWQLIEFGFG